MVERAVGSAALVLVGGATPLRPEPALFEAMLEGWRRQQVSRRLSGPLTDGRERVVRRFAEFGGWPWQWTSAQVEAWTAAGGWVHSTVQSYQGAVGIFLSYVCDPRYDWVAECGTGRCPAGAGVSRGQPRVHVARWEPS